MCSFQNGNNVQMQVPNFEIEAVDTYKSLAVVRVPSNLNNSKLSWIRMVSLPTTNDYINILVIRVEKLIWQMADIRWPQCTFISMQLQSRWAAEPPRLEANTSSGTWAWNIQFIPPTLSHFLFCSVQHSHITRVDAYCRQIFSLFLIWFTRRCCSVVCI